MLIPQISGSEFLIGLPGQRGQVNKVRFARAVGKRFLIALADELACRLTTRKNRNSC